VVPAGACPVAEWPLTGRGAGGREPRGVRLGARFARYGAAAAGVRPPYSPQAAQPIRSLSKPANMHASCVICSGRSSEGVSMSNERWMAEKMQSE
jgi:hypothetical protein